MATYSEADIKKYIENSDVFVISCLRSLNEHNEIKSKDTGLVESMLKYFNRFNKITDKHFALIRRRLGSYAETLTEWMNDNVAAYEAQHGPIVKS
mgnify:CR=1 FL=1